MRKSTLIKLKSKKNLNHQKKMYLPAKALKKKSNEKDSANQT
jgi:hypothetical protein